HRDGFLAAHWPWLLLLVAVLGAAAAGAWLYLKRHAPKKQAAEPLLAETVKLSARSFAFLEAQDEEHTRHPLTGEVFRIGRHADNELPLTDPSLSRHHAEIRHELNGRYVIRDLESLNGVYVNGKKCRSAVLANGDVIELGDVTLKFAVFAAHDRPGAEGIAQQGTVTPFRPTGKRKPRSS
ncbi:MAG: FHA domain-containing protein, partial [Gammaproteobacteria bacterium]|nr:FHA domain-containing protein [Gammaproteobacteria bacterium]